MPELTPERRAYLQKIGEEVEQAEMAANRPDQEQAEQEKKKRIAIAIVQSETEFEAAEYETRARQKLERAIVATVLADPAQYPHVVVKVKPEYFADGVCRRILGAQGELYRENIEPSAANLIASGRLSHDDSSELVDVTLAEDRFNLPMLTLRLCEMEADERRKAAQRAADGQHDVFKKLSTLRDGLAAAESVIQGAIRKSKSERINDVLMRASERASGKRKPFATGFPTIDTMLSGGLSEAGLSFVGGYAGEGKSSFALAIAIHAARQGIKVDFLEGEMTEDELHERGAGIHYAHDLVKWLQEYEKLPLDILTLADKTPARLLSSIEYSVVTGARLVVVDYLQSFAQMQTETDRQYLAIKNLSAQLRSLILRHAEKGTMIHVMALSNLNRNEAGSGRPGLSSLYGSSGLAHDCTEAFMLYSENSEGARMQEALTGHRAVTVELVKARNGQRGPTPFRFYGASQRFEEERLMGVRQTA